MSSNTPESLTVISFADLSAGKAEVIDLDERGNQVLFARAPDEYMQAAPADEPVFLVRLISPASAEFNIPAHWHPRTAEYFRVFAGTVIFTLDGVEHVRTPADGELTIPAGTVHAARVPLGVHCDFAERADPDPVRKMWFLRRLIGRGGQSEQLSAVQALRLFWEDGDSYPSVGPKILGIVLLYVFGGFFGAFLGFGKFPEREKAKIE